MDVRYSTETTFIIYIVLLVTSFKLVLCCDGFGLEVEDVRNCDKPGLITVEGNFTAILERNCDIVAKGCVKFNNSEPIRKFKLRYSLNKPTFVGTHGSVDVCKMTGSKLRCPLPARMICLHNELKVNIGGYKSLLPLAKGTVNLELNGELNKGNVCFKIYGNIVKTKRQNRQNLEEE